MPPTSWIEINLPRLDANLAAIRATTGPDVRVCCVVKADAYGLGAARIANRLAGYGVDMFAVYNTSQGEDLLGHGINVPLLILMPVRDLSRTDPLYRLAVTDRLHLTIHDPAQLDQVNRIGHTFGCRIPIHLYLDTGMSRSGLTHEQASDLLGPAETLRHVRLAGLYTHLATADRDPGFAQQQIDRLDQFLAQHEDRLPKGILIHAANTYATLRSPRYHYNMVRVGLGLFGYGDQLLQGPPRILDCPPLQPIVRWLSRINHIQRYPKGTSVGYGCTHQLDRDSVLGIVPAGYGDGYPVAMSNRASVRVLDPQQRKTIVTAPVVGRVSMDQIVIDLTPPADDTASSPDTPQIGSLVELVSDDPGSPNALTRLADLTASHPYEMLCRLSPRIPRRYVGIGTAEPIKITPQQLRQTHPVEQT